MTLVEWTAKVVGRASGKSNWRSEQRSSDLGIYKRGDNRIRTVSWVFGKPRFWGLVLWLMRVLCPTLSCSVESLESVLFWHCGEVWVLYSERIERHWSVHLLGLLTSIPQTLLQLAEATSSPPTDEAASPSSSSQFLQHASSPPSSVIIFFSEQQLPSSSVDFLCVWAFFCWSRWTQYWL